MTRCGAELGSIYDSGTITQTGATTALEQQDIWLILLDSPPAAGDAFYSGWDARGAAFTGGYTIHHALGENKQYVAWNGSDLFETILGTALSVAYDSTFWGVVNGLGNLGAGASGSALFSPNNQLIGSASLAALTAGENSLGVCPANPPATPTAKSVTALFTALSGVWTSTADRTSSTAGKTLKALLDPSSTDQLTTAGVATQPITFTASPTFANTGDPVTLSWDAKGAESCTAWGGTPGDGWAGVQPSSGSIQLTSAVGGTVGYSLSCLMGNQIGEGNATISWNYIAPLTNLFGGSASPLMLGATTAFNWDANVGPCVAAGGNAGDGWAGQQPTSGSLSLTVTQTGITQYTLTCGTGPRTATSSVFLEVVSPYITLVAHATQLRVGSTFGISWFGNGAGGACSASGGSSTDGWALYNAQVVSNGSTQITETVAGTYTYTLTCTGGGQSAGSSATVVFTDDPPAFSLIAVASQQQIYPSSALGKATLNLLWTSNVSGCSIDYTSISGQPQAVVLGGGNPSGAISDAEVAPGLVEYTLICVGVVASTTINWVTTATPNALSVNSSSWAANLAYPVSWNASSGPCVGSGGAPGDGWAASKAMAGTQSVIEPQPGPYVFTLACGSGAATATSKVVVTVPPPFIQIYYMGGVGAPIAWHSTVGPCTYVDGSAATSVGVPVPPSGSATPTPVVSGTYLFSLTCGSGASTLYAATLAQIAVNAPTTLTASVKSASVDAPVTLTWSSAANSICYATGGDVTAPWIATLPGSGSGSLIVTSRYAGALTYGINCNNETAQVLVTYVSVPATSADAATPAVTMSASASTQTQGQSVSLVWNSKNADACSASGGQQGDGWTGSLSPSGSMSVTEMAPDTVTYSVTCTGAPPAATATTTIVIKSAPVTTTTSSSHGGGGALDLLFLLSVALPLGMRVKTLAASRIKPPMEV